MRQVAVAALGALSAFAAPAEAKVALAPIFTGDMVLQRDRAIPLEGTATPGEAVTIAWRGAQTVVRADAGGAWRASLPAGAAGGPFTLSATDRDGSVSLANVLVGDVWLCSGQSNMEFTLRHATNAEAEVASASHPRLRLFNMPRQSSATPQRRPAAPVRWQAATPASAADFSAACYIMGRELMQHQQIPIGLIAASWGGSMIEEWLDRPTLSRVPRYREELRLLDLYQADKARGAAAWRDALVAWLGPRLAPAAGAAWQAVPQLGFWEEWGEPTRYFDGLGYYRARVTLRPDQVGAATLKMGAVDDIDVARVNGRVVGANQGWNTPRAYALAPGTLRAGENLIEVTVVDNGGGGGIWGTPPALELADGTSLAWEKVEFAQGDGMGRIGVPPGMPWIPGAGRTTLFNGMIAPLGDFPVTGFAWYQGEANVGDPDGYAKLMPMLAEQWRARFGGKPFIAVQLANFGPLADRPLDDPWGRFRDVQRRVAEGDPAIGLASAVDVGQPGDIHPTDKQSVGKRLALEARRLALGEQIVSRGPFARVARRGAGAITITFDNGPLTVIGADKAIGFELCDAAAKCRFVSGDLRGGAIVLPDDPAAREVRFLWQASPIVNLYNTAGLPASPFSLPVQ